MPGVPYAAAPVSNGQRSIATFWAPVGSPRAPEVHRCDLNASILLTLVGPSITGVNHHDSVNSVTALPATRQQPRCEQQNQRSAHLGRHVHFLFLLRVVRF